MPEFKLSKRDVAERQLDMAIELFFGEAEPVSIHTLTAASYEVAAHLAKKRNGVETIFDTSMIKDEFRKEWVNGVRKSQNFFKHADLDPDQIHNFNTDETKIHILMAIALFGALGWPMSAPQVMYFHWSNLHETQWLTKLGNDFLTLLPDEMLKSVRGIDKKRFYEMGFPIAQKMVADWKANAAAT